jgi:hypothetical protein
MEGEIPMSWATWAFGRPATETHAAKRRAVVGIKRLWLVSRLLVK